MASKTQDSNPQDNLLKLVKIDSISTPGGKVLYADSKLKAGVADILKSLGELKETASVTPGTALGAKPLAKDKALV